MTLNIEKIINLKKVYKNLHLFILFKIFQRSRRINDKNECNLQIKTIIK